MIISASFRTDIPAYYGEWFARRLEAGFARVQNPYGGPPITVRLDPAAAEGFVFWTRNVAPFRPVLERLCRERRPFYVSMTITGYPRALEGATLDPDRALADARALAAAFGARALVWRYDPIIETTLTPLDWHERNFADLAAALTGVTGEVVISFAQVYRKTRRNLDTAARRHGFAWSDPTVAEKQALAARLAAIARTEGMTLALCAQPELVTSDVKPALCIDAMRLSAVAGHTIRAREKGNRPGCLCHESRDIGGYDSCAQGCVYCYAVTSRRAAQTRLKRHDPASEFLIPPTP